MTTAKWTSNSGEQQDLCYPAARFNKNGCLLVLGGDALRHTPIALHSSIEVCYVLKKEAVSFFDWDLKFYCTYIALQCDGSMV
jgi:hypothetical protein